jgi:hypothetical protein
MFVWIGGLEPADCVSVQWIERQVEDWRILWFGYCCLYRSTLWEV